MQRALTVPALVLTLAALAPARPATEARLRAAVRADRENFRPWFDLGVFYWKSGDYRRAGRIWVEACERRPESPKLHFLTSRAYLRARQYRLAGVFLRRTRRLAPDHPKAGPLLERLAERDLIPADWVEDGAPAPTAAPPPAPPPPPAHPDDPLGGLVVRPDPDEATLAWEAARRSSELGDPGAAIEHFRRAYAAGRERSSVLIAMSPDLVRDEEPKKAIFALDEYLAENPQDPLAWVTLSHAHALRGAPEAQVQALEKALAIDPEYAEAHFHLALVYDRVGNFPQGLAHARRALQLDPDYKEELRHRIQDSKLAKAVGQEIEKVFRKERLGGLTDEDIDEVTDRLAAILGEEGLDTEAVLGRGDRRQRVRDIVQDIQEDRGREVLERIPAGSRRDFVSAVRRRAGDVDPRFEQALRKNLRRFAGS